jgi:hypothetical protein
MPPVAHRGNSWPGHASNHKHRRMRAVALVTAGHTTGLRGRKLRMELKNQTWAADPGSTGPVTARRYVLEDICKKLLQPVARFNFGQ